MTKFLSKYTIHLLTITLLASCATHQSTTLVIKSIDDIPLITDEYAKPLSQLKVGMNANQINSLFPYLERECYESGICHFTVFNERQIRVDSRLKDLDTLSGSLISLLALTCVISDEACKSALAAAINVGVAAMLEQANITNTHTPSSLLTLVQLINNQTVGVYTGQGPNKINKKLELGSAELTLIQWINIELEEGKVTKWAINEPLEQYKPKRFKNELPPLEQALGL